MKLEVGMYVRTKDGHIDKIKNIDEEYYCIGEDEEDKLYKIYQLSNTYYDDEFNEDNDWVFQKFIIKASYNIIEILKEGDYVNGCKVIKNTLKDGGNIVIVQGGNCFTNKEIKSIVTKEQFEQMSYEIGEEDDTN